MLLRVLSYNMHRAIGIDRRFRPERVARILRHHQADLVLLQEVDVGVPRSRMLNLAEEMAAAAGYPHYAVGLNVKLRLGSYGNATLSRYPIIHHRNIDLTIGNRKRRGCLYTTVVLDDSGNPGREIELFNLHLGLTTRERVRQVGNLIRSPEFATLAPEHPCLVGGDFNDWRTLLAPIFTDILDFECATNHSRGYHKAFLTYPSFSPAGGLDKIFYRGPLKLVRRRRCWMGVTRVASDHLPVIADFELE
ncbi:MAG: endonuclease/exonuclease/phosphatase family protein [Desulfobacterales bacterium]|nr:endonuclease/exonuclease/phosphatase family protein [Desulfobacterales bacterium]